MDALPRNPVIFNGPESLICCGEHFVRVDTADLPLLAGRNWSVRAPGVISTIRVGLPMRTMPNLITGFRRAVHVNGDPLDNRRSNIVGSDNKIVGCGDHAVLRVASPHRGAVDFLISHESVATVSRHHWMLGSDPAGRAYMKDCGRHWSLHRFIVQPPAHLVVDHINGDPRDNRLENLRAISQRDNNRNTRKRRSNKSGHKGVSWDKEKGRWVAYGKSEECKTIFLGRFDDVEEAGRVAREWRARNFPTSPEARATQSGATS